MKLEDAIRILNENRHNGYSNWKDTSEDEEISGPIQPAELNTRIGGSYHEELLTEFEATAIAEKYERIRQEKESETVNE